MSDAERSSADIEALAPVIRLRPIRTLVVSPDLAYHRRAMTILVELGAVSFAVVSLEDPDDIASLLRSEGADVVVLDATDCEAAAAVVIERLADASPRTGVVVVCHHCTEAARSLQALPKWGWTQDLRAAVELAYHDGNPLCPGALSSVRRRSALQRMAGPLRRR
jgi:DNA-binding NarL/FixJ family response regulator